MMNRSRTILVTGLAGLLAFSVTVGGQQQPVAGTATTPGNQWPPALGPQPGSPALSPQDAIRSFSLPPGYRVELVASEPMVESPILIDFDADGRMYVVEMVTFLPDETGRDSREPINRVKVLEDTNGDGIMDKSTLFADGLTGPRAIKVFADSVLIGDPPNLIRLRDTDGDLKADTRETIVTNFGEASRNIEHNANSLLWGIDNTIYSSQHVFNMRWTPTGFEQQPALSRGQWLMSQDDAGRTYRNVNSAPLFVDFTPSRYFLRNPNLARTRGLYEPLISQMDATVYPVRPNRGVNRGYRDPFFRPDGSAIVIQGTSGPMIYRGDRYPAELRGSAFIPDSPTNLVHRMDIVDQGGGLLKATNGFDRGEFLASSDERFRPVSVVDGPDGTLYIVDMYRGVVQAEGIWSAYLTDYIRANKLELPVGRGRIWRVVHGTGAQTRTPVTALSRATPAQLVETLSHPIGWRRDRAQQLLVQRQDRSVVPALTELAGSAQDWRTRLHALWTIDGLGAITQAHVTRAMADSRGDLRSAAIRIAERWLREGDAATIAAVTKLATDPHWDVRRQVAASIGEMPADRRTAPAVAILSSADGRDGIIVDALLSGLQGLEPAVLQGVMQASAAASQHPEEAVSMLVATITKSGDVAAVQQVIGLVGETTRPSWQRMAVLRGLDTALPARAAGRGRGLPGLSFEGEFPTTPGRGVTLPAAPDVLTRLASGTGDLAAAAREVADRLDWPGRPAPVVVAAALTPEQEKLRAAGATIYNGICIGCHTPEGGARENLGAALNGSALVNNNDPTAVIRILLGGKEGKVGLMPPLAATMTDEQAAAVLTYIRRSWTNAAPAVDPLNVMEIRGLTRTRTKPWTDEELQPPAGRGGRGGGGAGGGGRRGGGAGPAGGN